MTNVTLRRAIGGGLAGAALLALTAIPSFAQTPPVAPSPSPQPPTMTERSPREAMDGMMDAVHGEGTSRRMAEAMGPEGQKMMDQCAAMMSTTRGS